MPQAVGMLPLAGDTESPQNHKMILVVAGFLYVNVPEQTDVCPQKVIYPGPHLHGVPQESIRTVNALRGKNEFLANKLLM